MPLKKFVEEERPEPKPSVFESALLNFLTNNYHWLTKEKFLVPFRKRIAKAMYAAARAEIRKIKTEDILRIAKWRAFSEKEPERDQWVLACRGSSDLFLVRRRKSWSLDDVYINKDGFVIDCLDAWVPVGEAQKLGWEEEF